MIKIAFLIRSLDYGGSERQLVTLVKALDQKIFDITVFCFYPGGSFEKDLENCGVKIISLEKQGRWDLFNFTLRFGRHLKNIQPDVIHGYLSDPNCLIIFLKPLFPSIRMVWGVRASNLDSLGNNWLSRLTYSLEYLLSHFADLIIVNSHAGRAYHAAHGYPMDKMIVIPNGIDINRFKPDLAARARVRAEWGITENTILIGLVARLDPLKDHPTFLKAAALLAQQQQDVRFVCVGGGSESYVQELYQLAHELGISEKVIWAGGRADVPAVQNALDIATCSSYTEGFPNVIGEAMACSVPCVVTDVGDSTWIVGNTGIVVPPQNPEALAAGWMSCLQKDRSKLGVKARSRIVEKFSVQQLVEQTQEAIESLLN